MGSGMPLVACSACGAARRAAACAERQQHTRARMLQHTAQGCHPHDDRHGRRRRGMGARPGVPPGLPACCDARSGHSAWPTPSLHAAQIVAYFSDSSLTSATMKSDGPTASPVRTDLAVQDAASVVGDLAARTAAAADADACTDRIGQCPGPLGPGGFAAASHYQAAAVTPRADWRRAAS